MTELQKKSGWISKLSIVLTGQVFSLLGSGIVQFSIIWHLNKETNSPVYLSIAMIMGILPIILLSPIAGVFADRYNRKNILMAADAMIAGVTLLFYFLLQLTELPIDLLFVLLFVRAAGTAFHQPAFEAAMPMITPKKQLVRVNAIIQMLRSGISLLAPMLAALLIGVLPLGIILLIDVFTAAVAIVSLLLIHLPDLIHKSKTPATLRGYMEDLRCGLRYIYHWKGLLMLIIVFSLANFLLAPMLAMMPLVITNYFNGGATEYGFFEMALAIGLIFGSLSLSVWGGAKRKIVGVNIAQAVSGICVASIIIIPPNKYYLVLVATVIAGIASAYTNSPVTAILQTCVDKNMLGRVMSIGAALCSIAMPVSLVITGPLANAFGPIPIIWMAGLLSMVLGVICFFIPSLMRIEEHVSLKAEKSEVSTTAD